MEQPRAGYVFEASWEVCNKVGGIYTVLQSKASQMMMYYPNYIAVGPYFEHNARIEFTPAPIPEPFKGVFESMRRQGIECHYGRWEEAKGKPSTILIDFKNLIGEKNNIKREMWEWYQIDSLRGNWDFEEPSIWSYAVGKLLAELAPILGKTVVAHFHEWLAGFGLLYVKKYAPTIGTVFTTHATTLGRTLASTGMDFYAQLPYIDPHQQAYVHTVEAKHLTERAAAINADVFTTVSEITSIEAEKFLGRKADVLVLNGLDIGKFPSFEQTSITHISSRNRIREFLTYYFFPHYTFDLEHNIVLFTVGRFEYHNKGYDILIPALGRLNELLKAEKKDPKGHPEIKQRTVAVLLWIPMQHYGIKLEVLENKNYYMQIKSAVHANAPEILNKLIEDFISKRDDRSNILSEAFLSEMKKDVIAFTRKGNPPLSTHNIDDSNSILTALRNNGLLNREEDPVKVIVEPVYLDGTDGIIELGYYDAMVGCHLGLFPSYYEPWGYTPLESAALGVTSLTTDLSGFGMFLKSNHAEQKGIFVLERFNKNTQDIIAQFTNTLHNYARLTHAQRVDLKIAAKHLAANADWTIFIHNYIAAHNLALSKKQH